MASWDRPECRTDEIDTLINSVERYNPANTAVLEDYLALQIREDSYDSLANLALLKLLQFNPDSVVVPDDPDEPDTIQLVLVKALAHKPFAADLSLCVSLLGDRTSTVLSSPDSIQAFEAASTLSNLLRQRNFPQFWDLLRSKEIYAGPFSPALESLPSFAGLVRKSIAESIADTFKSLDKSRADRWLGFTKEENEKDKGLENFAKEIGWMLDSDTIRIPNTEANDPKSTVHSETVDLSRMVRTLAQSIQV
ncbi:MAG: hypothetical protein CYPHOPRED_003031 [Cyphobasidiales sp. Tagirdzhanova-0007]|nr:MAG: hypothetical protein CYPHOPRED_003031 [Cyphobasidiales sp. Tagirdzhanova-0007]